MRATSSSSGGFGARQRNWLGGWDRCRACVSTGRWAFYPIGNKSAARSCQTTIAAQSIRRMPCGQQIAKPAYSCLTIKNQNHYQLASLRSQLAAARFLRKSDTVNNRTWREANPEDTLRFYALRLHEVGMLKTNPNKLIAQGTDWRFLNELKSEIKA